MSSVVSTTDSFCILNFIFFNCCINKMIITPNDISTPNLSSMFATLCAWTVMSFVQTVSIKFYACSLSQQGTWHVQRGTIVQLLVISWGFRGWLWILVNEFIYWHLCRINNIKFMFAHAASGPTSAASGRWAYESNDASSGKALIVTSLTSSWLPPFFMYIPSPNVLSPWYGLRWRPSPSCFTCTIPFPRLIVLCQ